MGHKGVYMGHSWFTHETPGFILATQGFIWATWGLIWVMDIFKQLYMKRDIETRLPKKISIF